MQEVNNGLIGDEERTDACHMHRSGYRECVEGDEPHETCCRSAPAGRGQESTWHNVATDSRKGVRRVGTYRFWKGGMDRCFAVALVVTLSPLLALMAALIRLDSSGKPIFAQERAGKNGRVFTVYKFRTMYADNDDSAFRDWEKSFYAGNEPRDQDADGNGYYKMVNDPRVTRVGAFLRKTNLDELPQVLNVLKGEMSFVGPRPEMASTVDELYGDWHRARLETTPGITGLWQVYGRGRVSFDDMVRMDIDYIQRQSLLLDAKIVLRTFTTFLGLNGS
jgi:lipopolysaccharide/colanic/teichoic acid biosynthesis glycosyltransferase